MLTSLKTIGNSTGIIIPKRMLAEIGAQAGDDVEMSIQAGQIVIAPSKRRVREGWADDAKRLAATGDDALVWPEFANENDSELEW